MLCWVHAALLFTVFLLIPLGAKATQIQSVVSPNGIKAWLVEEPAIPLLSMSFSFSGGASVDPEGRDGTGNMVSGLLDEGAGPYNSLEFQKKLELLAVRMNFSIDKDSFSGNLRTLSKNRDEAFELLRLALNEPHFEAEAIERIRRQIITSLIEEKENPNAIAGRLWFKTAFPGHPYGRSSKGGVESVKSITVNDLRNFLSQVFAKDRLRIGVVGDITGKSLGVLLDRAFGPLPQNSENPKISEITLVTRRKVKVVERAIPQSQVIFGGQGLKRDDPDWYAAYILNYVVGGGGFSSRLNDQVREKRGLAYSIYSYLYPLDHAGLFLGGVGTKNSSVMKALKIINEEIERVRANGISGKELADAKLYLNGSFPLRLTSSSRIARLLLAMQHHNLGINYIEQRVKLINKVTLEDVHRVAKRLLQPKNFLTVVVGQPVGLRNTN